MLIHSNLNFYLIAALILDILQYLSMILGVLVDLIYNTLRIVSVVDSCNNYNSIEIVIAPFLVTKLLQILRNINACLV